MVSIISLLSFLHTGLLDVTVVRKMKTYFPFLVINGLSNFVAHEREEGHFHEQGCKGRYDDEFMSPFWLLLLFPLLPIHSLLTYCPTTSNLGHLERGCAALNLHGHCLIVIWDMIIMCSSVTHIFQTLDVIVSQWQPGYIQFTTLQFPWLTHPFCK